MSEYQYVNCGEYTVLSRKYPLLAAFLNKYGLTVMVMYALVGYLGLISQPATVFAQPDTHITNDPNPPAPDFNLEGSDAKAIEIADRVMNAMGGRKAWDETRYVSWNFFGRRHHLWDKYTGNVRIEAKDEKGSTTTWLMNINTNTGQVRLGDKSISTDGKMLEQGYSAWVNDSYWLFMPYKLKDSGVTLKYIGEGKTEVGNDADIIELTFAKVGLTPQNKYHIWVGKQSNLVEQWAYYAKATDDEPKFVIPWANWQKYGKILLSGDRGKAKITNIAVPESVPQGVFSSFNKINWNFNKKKNGSEG